MVSQKTKAALKKQREEKKKKKGLMKKMSQGKSCGIFIRSSISGPVGGQSSLSKRVFDR